MLRANLKAVLQAILQVANSKRNFSVHDLNDAGIGQTKSRAVLDELQKLGYLIKGGSDPNNKLRVLYHLRDVDLLESYLKSSLAAEVQLPSVGMEIKPLQPAGAPSKEVYVPPKPAPVRAGGIDAFKIPSKGIA